MLPALKVYKGPLGCITVLGFLIPMVYLVHLVFEMVREAWELQATRW